MRSQRAAMRTRIGADERTLVLTAFGSGNPARLMDYVSAATGSVAASGARTMLLNLGFDPRPVSAGPSVEVLAPGRLEPGEVASYLAASDLFLAPFIDGVSTRRTTVMAALQHGIPVLGTDGPLTDPVFRHSTQAIALTPVKDRAGFARAARALADDVAARRQLGAEGRRLYEQEFDWGVTSERLVCALRTHAASSRD